MKPENGVFAVALCFGILTNITFFLWLGQLLSSFYFIYLGAMTSIVLGMFIALKVKEEDKCKA